MFPPQLKERRIADHQKQQWKECEGNEERVEGSKVFLCLRRSTVADGMTARFFVGAQLVWFGFICYASKILANEGAE